LIGGTYQIDIVSQQATHHVEQLTAAPGDVVDPPVTALPTLIALPPNINPFMCFIASSAESLLSNSTNLIQSKV